MTDDTRNSVGVDISKAHLDAHMVPSGKAARFSNDAAGFKALIAWVERPVRAVTYEPTGRWHRAFEETLFKAELPLARVNPLQARRFAQAIGQRAKTDAVDARMLAQMGAALDLRRTEASSPAQRALEELQVARDALVKDRTAALNRQKVHAGDLRRQHPASTTTVPTIHFVSLFIAVRTSAEAPVRSQDVPRPRQASSDLDCRTSQQPIQPQPLEARRRPGGPRWAARTRTPGSARRLTPVTAAGSGVSPPAPPARTGRCVPPHPSPEASAYSASAPPGRHPGRAARCRPRQARSRVRRSPGLGVKASAVRLRVTIVVADLGLLVQVHGVPEGGVTPDLACSSNLLAECRRLTSPTRGRTAAASWPATGDVARQPVPFAQRLRRLGGGALPGRAAGGPLAQPAFQLLLSVQSGPTVESQSASIGAGPAAALPWTSTSEAKPTPEGDDGQQGRRQSAAAAGSSHVGRAYCTSSGGGGRGIPESLSVDLPHGEQREAHDRRRAGDRRRRQARGLARRRE